MTEEQKSPAISTVDGVEFVTVPRTYFRDLVSGGRRRRGKLTEEQLQANTRSRIDRDPEVAQFLTECFGRMQGKEAVEACRERFGAERTPPRSTLSRFWQRLRAGEAPKGAPPVAEQLK